MSRFDHPAYGIPPSRERRGNGMSSYTARARNEPEAHLRYVAINVAASAIITAPIAPSSSRHADGFANHGDSSRAP